MRLTRCTIGYCLPLVCCCLMAASALADEVQQVTLPWSVRVIAPAPSCPGTVANWAVPGRTNAYDGYYVGGGGSIRPGPRCRQDGTWGWDYEGCVFLRRIWLAWNHGSRYQGGQGAYKTDGPPVRNVLTNTPPPAASEKDH